jgi:hypothetical protein
MAICNTVRYGTVPTTCVTLLFESWIYIQIIIILLRDDRPVQRNETKLVPCHSIIVFRASSLRHPPSYPYPAAQVRMEVSAGKLEGVCGRSLGGSAPCVKLRRLTPSEMAARDGFCGGVCVWEEWTRRMCVCVALLYHG